MKQIAKRVYNNNDEIYTIVRQRFNGENQINQMIKSSILYFRFVAVLL